MFDRGYTGHEHIDELALINMNGRMYDPLLGRFLSPDNYVQDPFFSQSFNRYAYALNNPMSYIDPDGEVWWLVPVIVAAVFGVGNTAVHAARGDIDNVWDGLKYFAQGAATGFALGCTWQFAPLIPYLGQGIQTCMTGYTILQGASFAISNIVGLGNGLFADNWDMLKNTWKIFGGNFYLDENEPWKGMWYGYSRHTWESIQTFAGGAYSQSRNMFDKVDRVDYLGGQTFVTREYADGNDGVTIGNYANMRITGRITGNFDNYVITHPLYMHEYGHIQYSRLMDLCIL